jgi:CheY-like chemotaxis protein
MGQLKVLIVEDESIVALDLQLLILSLGYEVADIVDTGRDAITQAHLLKPDLIMMDIILQDEMDGLDAARIITAQLDIPILFVSALFDDRTLERVKNIPNAGFIVKPYSEIKLRDAISSVLNMRKP